MPTPPRSAPCYPCPAARGSIPAPRARCWETPPWRLGSLPPPRGLVGGTPRRGKHFFVEGPLGQIPPPALIRHVRLVDPFRKGGGVVPPIKMQVDDVDVLPCLLHDRLRVVRVG